MRILLVDDDAPILQLLSQFLTRAGHVPTTAGSVAEALAVAAAGSPNIDAAVIDLALPDGSGEEVAREILDKHPQARVVIASGYFYEAPSGLAGKVAILQKPFMPRALLNVLTQAD